MAHPSARGLRIHRLTYSFILLISLAITCLAAAVPSDVSIRSKEADASLLNDLEERFNKWVVGVGMTLIGVTGPWLGTACAATPITFGIPCIALVSTFALGSILGVIGSLVGGGDKMLAIRSAHSNMVHRPNWRAQHLATGRPVIMAHHDCYGPECLQSEYSLHTTKSGKALHRVLTGPRRKDNGTNHISSTLSRRQSISQGYGDYTPSGDDYTQEFFLDYLFEIQDDTAASALVAGYDYNEYDEDWSFAGAVDTDLVNDNGQGYYCMNLAEPDYGDGQATYGYAGFFEGEMEQDPDNEDAYIAQCQGEGLTDDYRTYEFDGRRRK